MAGKNSANRKGIILCGGLATRLRPATTAVSKQLLPVYDKPMVYYPLSTLMLAGIREILIIVTSEEKGSFERLLGDGAKWGLEIHYAVQASPKGIAHALIRCEEFVSGRNVALILGDNVFYGHELQNLLVRVSAQDIGAAMFAYHVADSSQYGVVHFDERDRVIKLEEKPHEPRSQYAVPGLYFYDGEAISLAKRLKPSSRGELEITDLNRLYLNRADLSVEIMGRGFVWFDAGTPQALLDAAQFVAAIEQRQGLKIACPEEIAWRQKWIDSARLELLATQIGDNSYGRYLLGLLN